MFLKIQSIRGGGTIPAVSELLPPLLWCSSVYFIPPAPPSHCEHTDVKYYQSFKATRTAWLQALAWHTAFAALSRPLSPACYRWCHFINKAITLERGREPRLWDAHKHTHTRTHTHSHTHLGQVLGLSSLGGDLTLTSLVQRQGSFMGHQGAACME